MSHESDESKGSSGDGHGPDARAPRPATDRVQCPNCCRLAPVTSRSMGLLFYQCELCLTTGAAPDPAVASK